MELKTARVDVPIAVYDLIVEMGMERVERVLREDYDAVRDRRLRGSLTVAGLALPETVTEWAAGGKVGVTVDEDGTVYVKRGGDMTLTTRSISRQGILQQGWLRERMLWVGYRFKDKILFRHDVRRDEFVGEKYFPPLSVAEMLAEGVTADFLP